MNSEKRVIKASIYAGASEIMFGLLMYLTGWGDWYFNKFHFFGIMGICMIFYAYWHDYFLIQDTGEGIWKKKR